MLTLLRCALLGVYEDGIIGLCHIMACVGALHTPYGVPVVPVDKKCIYYVHLNIVWVAYLSYSLNDRRIAVSAQLIR